MSAEYVLEMKNITKRYGENTVLSDVSLSVRPGEIHALLGENGAGKSTLMKMLAGMSSPSEGSFTLFGKAPKEDARLYQRVGTLIEQHGRLRGPGAFGGRAGERDLAA